MKYLLIFLLPFSVFANAATDTTLRALSKTAPAQAIQKHAEKKAVQYGIADVAAPMLLLYQQKVKIGRVVIDIKNKSAGFTWEF